MRIVIVGAGTVGTNIALFLTREFHDVLLVDSSKPAMDAADQKLDVQLSQGNACDPEFLRTIEIGNADVFLAVTNQDDTNLVAAFTAKQMGCRRVVARVRSQFYTEFAALVNFRAGLGIDLLVSPEEETATELGNFVRTPDALATVTLAQGKVEMRTLKVAEECPFIGKELRHLDLPRGVLVAGVRGDGDARIARGHTILNAGDRVTLMGLPSVLEEVSPAFHGSRTREDRSWVVVAGGGETGLTLTKKLQEQKKRVTLIERDLERIAQVGRKISSKVIILSGDATSADFLKEERIGRADYFIAAMGDDENNIMATMLAKELGVEKTACVIDRPDYTRIVERMGIDVAISPRFVAANKILAMVRRGRIRSVTLIEDGELEVNEYEALSTSEMTGQMLMDIAIPNEALIGAVARAGKVTIPRGDFIIQPGDTVITVARPEATERLDALFAETPKSPLPAKRKP